MEFLSSYLTDEMYQKLMTFASMASVILIMFVKVVSWVFKDRTTHEQKQLAEAIIRRLENGSLDWAEVGGDLVLFDQYDDKLEVQRHWKNGAITLGSFNVTQLTRSQKKKIEKLVQKKKNEIKSLRDHEVLNATIREARRPV